MDGTYTGVANLDLKRSESWTWTPHLTGTPITSTLSLDTKTIRGLNGPGRVTLDGGGTNRLFDLSLSGSVAATVKVHNLTLRRGYAGAGVGGMGGAIRVTGSAGSGSLELRNCVLSGNSATTAGGAIHATGSGINLQLSHSNYYPPSISTGTRFLTNTCAYRGGAVYVTNAALMISGSHFEGNIAGTTGSTGEGGALFLGHPALGTVTSASYSSRAHEISATLFSRNLAGWRGGAVAISDVSPLLTNSAFTENRSTGSTAQGGAISVAWEVPSSGNSLVPNHTPAPKIVHGTFARNQGNEGANVLAQLLTTPWFINSLFSDGWSPRPTPSLIGPRHLWGSQIAPPDALVAPTETDSTRRNLVDGIAQTTAPVLAFDWFHLASPVRIPVPTDSSTDTGGVEPSGSVSFTRPSADIDNEPRPAFVTNKFTLIRGCDEPRDGESPADGLPDWFEKLGYEYSPYDALTALSHIAPGGTTLQLATVSPTNNPDADAYTITQELLNGGRPDLPESEFVGRDSDGDGLSDVYERTSLLALEWRDPDQNSDGVADGWSIRHFGVLAIDLEADADGDGISNGSEANLGLNPNSFDSDGDGVPDLWEILAGTNPFDIDSNHDGNPDVWGAFPPDGAVSLAGLHLPSAAEPWYVERAWSAFDFDPGSHFREDFETPGIWILGEVNSYSDSFRELGPLTPSFLLSNAFRERLNSMDDHDQSRPSTSINRSLAAITAHHLNLVAPVYYPQLVGLEPPSETVSALLGNRQPTESWASQWFDAVNAWAADKTGARQAWHIHGSPVLGVATQKWSRYNYNPQHINPEATRLVQKMRLRCPIPGGAPQAVSQSYLRIRGHAARLEQYPTSATTTTTHPADENNFTITPVTLTLAKGAQVGPEITLDPHEPTLRATTNPTLPAPAASTNSGLDYFELVQFDCLLPIDIGVDNNRDGTLVLGSGPDQTTEPNPYRFWLNNDDDTGWAEDTYFASKDNPWTPGVVDSLDDKIKEARDLEDFARIHLKVDSLHAQLAAGTITLGLKWKAVQAGAPKIRLFKAVETDGGTKYLSDVANASDQVSSSTNSLGIVQGTTVLDLPVSFWTSTPSSATKYFLFEAIGEGKGELTMVFKQGGTVVAEGGSVFLDLLDIRKMYEQWGISAAAVIPDPDRDVLLPISGVNAISYQAAPHIFQPAWDENLSDKEYVICVHGWRKGGHAAATTAQFYKGRSDEITMFKRLWHRGFKGRYIGFIWPTYDVEVGTQNGLDAVASALQSKFQHSEYRAWKCGAAFKTMVHGLPAGYNKKVMAHSLGNVLVGSALEQGLVVHNYALLNAVIPARCYHKNAATPINNLKSDLSDDSSTAIRVLSYLGDAATLGYARLENTVGKLSNFYLPDDFALSGTGGWEDGQFFLKPVGSYEYDVTGVNEVQWDPPSLLVNRSVTDPHEAMAMVNISHSKAVGSAPVAAGASGVGIDTNINFNDPGMSFDKEHEAAFKWRCSKTWEFYSKLWDELNLAGTKAP